MKKAIGGLLLNARRSVADAAIHHHHHHHQHKFCASSAFAQAAPTFERTHDYAHAHQPLAPSAQAAAAGVSHHYHPHQHPKLSAFGSILNPLPRTHLCNTSAFTSTSSDPQVVTLAAPTRMGALLSSTLKGPIQQATSDIAEIAEDSACDDAEPPCNLSTQETRKLLKLIKMEDFRKHLLNSGRRSMPLEEVLKVCKQTGTATSEGEAEEVVKALDEAGSILIFRQKVFLEPEKVAEVLSKAMPLPLAVEDDPRNKEYARLQREKEEIDSIAHKQVRHMLWGALGALSAQSALFFRLTFWELSWDVMEPIAFFVTSSSLLAGFFFFVITKRDPSYYDFMDTLFSSKQRKLMKKRNFDAQRFKELQVLCCFPGSPSASSMRQQLSHAC